MGGLYFEGLIHGGAYFRNLTVRPTAFPGVSSVFGKWKTQLRAIISRNGMNSGCPAAWLLKNRKLRIEKIGKLGNFALKNRRKIRKLKVLLSTKIYSYPAPHKGYNKGYESSDSMFTGCTSTVAAKKE